MTRRILALVVASLGVLAAIATAVQCLYVLDCGRNIGRDQARWSPGVNEGKRGHVRGLLLWDAGVPDAVATMPDGMVVANGANHDRAQSEGLRYAPAYYEWRALNAWRSDPAIRLIPRKAVSIRRPIGTKPWIMLPKETASTLTPASRSRRA